VQGRSHPGAREAKNLLKKISLSPDEIRFFLAFIIVMKKGKILKIKP